jgi:dipeptidase E
MGKLFFYSDQVRETASNRRLDDVLFADRRAKIGYIPSTEDKEKKYFHMKARYYRDYGVQDVLFFDLYEEFDSSKVDELLRCDVIHLSAGDPIEGRKVMKKRKMDDVLRKYVHQGGTIVGVSGGAVQLGKSIKLYELFTGESHDELDALQLVDFEFLPHYNRWNEDFKQKVLAYVETTGTTVYTANDGDGMIVDEDGSIQLIGDIVVINSKKPRAT